MKKQLKTILKITFIIFSFIAILITTSLIRHKISLSQEQKNILPLGTKVEIDGHNMNVYVEGKGEHTIVFLSGSGTCSPILDFKSLYSLLRDNFRIVVIEKYGYGFSDDFDCDRRIDVVVNQNRAALKRLNISGPFILCPHSMSGIEALYWAKKFPDEVEAIVGLDMAVPEYYDIMKINMSVIKLSHYAAAIGITRWIPELAESAAIKNGTLSEDEKDLYKALFYRRTATVSMLNEAKTIKQNAQFVKEKGIPSVPMLLFISNGTGGTGFDENTWRSIPKKYIAGCNNANYVELDCPHYVHDFEYEKISEQILQFANSLSE